jgi:hypothetical protein
MTAGGEHDRNDEHHLGGVDAAVRLNRESQQGCGAPARGSHADDVIMGVSSSANTTPNNASFTQKKPLCQ